MRALAIVHQPDAGPGVFAEEAAARGWALDEWLLPAGGPPPADPFGYDAVLSFGGAMHADQEAEHPWLAEEKRLLADLLARDVALMGVCLGSQLLAEAAGAAAERSPSPEIGWFDVEVAAEAASDPVIGALAPGFRAFQWHSYRSPVPPGAVELARSPVSLQAFRIRERAWGIQFHAEVTKGHALAWAAHYSSDPDAVRVGIDPAELSSSIHEHIDAWNQLGRGLCGRFLDVAV